MVLFIVNRAANSPGADHRPWVQQFFDENPTLADQFVKGRTDDTRIVVTGEAPAQRARAREDDWQTTPTQSYENNFSNSWNGSRSWDDNRSRSYWQWR